MKTNRLIKRIVTLFLCLALLLPIAQNFFTLEAWAVTENVYSEDFEDTENEVWGWKRFYGGKVSVTDEASASGNYSLKMTGRTKSWHSPGLNIYTLVRDYGAGTYTVTMKVMATSVDETNPRIGMLVRTTIENSFSKEDKDGNYYVRLTEKKDFEANKWTTLSGSFSVSESDIEVQSSTFNLMIDLLSAETGQVLYIDDVKIDVSYPNPDFKLLTNEVTLNIGEVKNISIITYSGLYTTKYVAEQGGIAVAGNGKITGLSSGTTRIAVNRGNVTKYCTVTVTDKKMPIEDGTYYIRNSELKNYMQIDNNYEDSGYMNDNVIMELWNFKKETYQQWNVTHVGDGYYKIISNKSGKALSVRSGKEDSDNVALVQETYSGSDRQKWTIIRLESGNYKLKPKSSELKTSDWCMAAGSGILTANGRNVEQRKFVNDDERIDEWTMLSTNIDNAERVVRVDVLYDRGYAERYGDPISEISSQMTKLSFLFWNEFGIRVEYSKPTYYTSTADLCPNTYYDNLCKCASDDECVSSNGSAHHKNVKSELNNLQNSDGEYCVRMLFSGHAMCDKHGVYKTLGLMKYNKCVITGNSIGNLLTETVIHEFGHFYGAPDHYNMNGVLSTDEINSSRNTSLFDKNCIYGENKSHSPVLNNFTICDGCRAEMQKNIDTYNHK